MTCGSRTAILLPWLSQNADKTDMCRWKNGKDERSCVFKGVIELTVYPNLKPTHLESYYIK